MKTLEEIDVDAAAVRQKVVAVMFEIFELGGEDLAGDLLLRDLESWDSLRHMEMVGSIESEFGIRLSGDEIVELETLDGIESAVMKHLARHEA